jgi:hypothetical protein
MIVATCSAGRARSGRRCRQCGRQTPLVQRLYKHPHGFDTVHLFFLNAQHCRQILNEKSGSGNNPSTLTIMPISGRVSAARWDSADAGTLSHACLCG